MKFDIAITNPPYGRNLHLKILEKVIPHCEETINISPAAWLLDYSSVVGWRKTTRTKYIEELGPKLISYKLLDSGEFNDLFNASLGTKGLVGKFSNEANSDVYKEVSANNKLKVSILNKVSKKIIMGEMPNIKDQYSKHKEYEYWIKMARVHGNSGKWDEYDIIARDIKKSFCVKDKSGEGKEVYFETKEEAENFFKSVQNIFMRYIKYLGCWTAHDFNTGLPWMGNVEDGYKSPWTNKRFCDYFNITGYIDDEHAEPGSEWEEILSSMSKYK